MWPFSRKEYIVPKPPKPPKFKLRVYAKGNPNDIGSVEEDDVAKFSDFEEWFHSGTEPTFTFNGEGNTLGVDRSALSHYFIEKV